MAITPNQLPPIGGPSPVSGGVLPFPRWAIITVIATVALVLFLGYAFYAAMNANKREKETEKSIPVGTAAQFKPPPLEQPAIVTTAKPPPVVEPRLPGVGSVSPEQAALVSPMRSGQQRPQQNRPTVNENQNNVAVVKRDDEENGGGEIGKRLEVTRLKGAKATRIKHPMFTITQGTQIPCVPENPIDSTLPGFVECRIPINIYGTERGVVLLDAGTKVVGQIQTGLMQGQRRLFVVWTRAETPSPNHIVVEMDSPAADQMGQSGLDGDINTHFWERFGGAIMLSFIDTGLQTMALYASQAAQKGGSSGSNNTSFNQFSSNGSSVANSALQSTINIPPTLHRDQALPAIIFMGRDLDFSTVYGLELDP